MSLNLKSHYIFALLIFFSCKENELPQLVCPDSTNNWGIENYERPTEFEQNDLYLFDKSIGVSVGFGGSILKTSDGGRSWEVLNDRYFINKLTELKLKCVYLLNQDHLFIGGERKDIGDPDELHLGAVFIKSSDGGKTWNKRYFEEIQSFHDIFFSNALHGVSIATVEVSKSVFELQLLSTDNGGESWEEIITPGNQVASKELFYTSQNLFTITLDEVGNSVFSFSDDNGFSWNHFPLPEQECNRIYMINDQLGFITCGDPFSEGTVYKTENKGMSWSLDDISPINDLSIVHFSSDLDGIVINSVYESRQISGENHLVLSLFEIYETSNGGELWTKSIAGSQCDYDGVYFSVESSSFCLMNDSFHKFFE